MNAKGCVKEDGAFKFYEQESSRRGMTYHARCTTHDARPTHPSQLVNLSRGSVVSIASYVQGESDYFYEQQSRLEK